MTACGELVRAGYLLQWERVLDVHFELSVVDQHDELLERCMVWVDHDASEPSPRCLDLRSELRVIASDGF
jgi:hypothetical protein